MNITGKLLRFVTNEDGNLEATILIENYRDRMSIKELTKDFMYRISFTAVKSKRTLEQNRLMWAVIHEIADADNGDHATSNDDWTVYLEALERAGARFEYIACLPQAEDMLRDQFRAIKYMNSFDHKGKTFNQYKCFYGSSKLDTKEMGQLMDTVLDMAAERDISILPMGIEE